MLSVINRIISIICIGVLILSQSVHGQGKITIDFGIEKYVLLSVITKSDKGILVIGEEKGGPYLVLIYYGADLSKKWEKQITDKDISANAAAFAAASSDHTLYVHMGDHYIYLGHLGIAGMKEAPFIVQIDYDGNIKKASAKIPKDYQYNKLAFVGDNAYVNLIKGSEDVFPDEGKSGGFNLEQLAESLKNSYQIAFDPQTLEISSAVSPAKFTGSEGGKDVLILTWEEDNKDKLPFYQVLVSDEHGKITLQKDYTLDLPPGFRAASNHVDYTAGVPINYAYSYDYAGNGYVDYGRGKFYLYGFFAQNPRSAPKKGFYVAEYDFTGNQLFKHDYIFSKLVSQNPKLATIKIDYDAYVKFDSLSGYLIFTMQDHDKNGTVSGEFDKTAYLFLMDKDGNLKKSFNSLSGITQSNERQKFDVQTNSELDPQMAPFYTRYKPADNDPDYLKKLYAITSKIPDSKTAPNFNIAYLNGKMFVIEYNPSQEKILIYPIE